MYNNDFFRDNAKHLVNRIDEAREYFKDHMPSLGYVGEELLREFLRELFKSHNISVTQGFIRKDGKISRQCDIIIYDPSKDTERYHVGELSIVSANSVKAVIEVKTSIQKKTWQTTLCEIKKLKVLDIQNFYLFVCGKLSIKTLETFLFGNSSSNEFQVDSPSKYDHGDEYYLPKCICSVQTNATYTMDYIDCGRDSMGYLCVDAIDDKDQQIASLHEFLLNIWVSVLEDTNTDIFPEIAYFNKPNGVVLYYL